MSAKQGAEEGVSKEVNINEIIKPYVRRWLWFVVSVIIMIGLAVLFLKSASSVYQIDSTVLVKDAKKSPSGNLAMLSDFSGFGNMGTNSIENEIEVFKSKKLMNDVVESLGLQVTLYAEEGLKKNELYGENAPILIQVIKEREVEKLPKKPVYVEVKGDKVILSSEELPKEIVTTFNTTINLPYALILIKKNTNVNIGKIKKQERIFFKYSTSALTVSDLQKNTSVDLVDKDGTVIGVTTKQSNIEKGKEILNNLVVAYNNDAIKDKNAESKKTKDFIDERISIIANELSDVEGQKAQFKEVNGITDIAGEASLNLGKSSQFQYQLLETDTQLALADDLLGYLAKAGPNQTLPSSVGLSNPTATTIINAYNQLVLERNSLLESATPNNPVVADLTQQIKNLRGSVVDAVSKFKTNLLSSRAKVESEQSRVDSQIKKVPAHEKVFRSIERQQKLKENLYLLLLEKREETAINLAMTAPKARVIDYAYASEKPVAPKKMITLAAAMLFGLLVPFGLIYIRELLNTKIRNKKELELLTEAAVIAELPRAGKDQEMIKTNDLTPMAETFRILLSNLRFMLPEKKTAQILFVTSTVKGEGKTFVSMNLALTLAASNKRILLVGSDIRNPQLQRYDHTKKGKAGLAEYLHDNTTSIDTIIYKNQFAQNLDVLYSGSIPPNPVQLFGNGNYELLLEELKEKYDYIIVDTAPLLLVTDTLLISYLADAFIYVVRSKYTERTLIEFINKNIAEDKISNVALVLNDVAKDEFGYGNKYGYGYHNDEDSFFEKVKKVFRR